MTQDETTTETQAVYRIHWRNASGATGHETGLYSEAEAAIWVPALNRDEANVKQGRVYWAEPVPWPVGCPFGHSEASSEASSGDCQGLMAK